MEVIRSISGGRSCRSGRLSNSPCFPGSLYEMISSPNHTGGPPGWPQLYPVCWGNYRVCNGSYSVRSTPTACQCLEPVGGDRESEGCREWGVTSQMLGGDVKIPQMRSPTCC